MRKFVWVFIAMVVLPLIWGGCRREKKVDVSNINPAKMPTMYSRNVATFISDSGVIQYKIVAPKWYVYDNIDTPYWTFPEGIYLQKYDRGFNTIASVAADSARYYKYKKLWRLNGNVEMHKEPKMLFLTQQLFWDERKDILYSDSFIHVETADRILEGYGFLSNSNLTQYRVTKPSGTFPAPNLTGE